MRRTLFDQIKTLPYTAGEPIDRDDALSVVMGVVCSEATGTPTLSLVLSHCDKIDGTYDGVPDTRALMFKQPVPLSEGGAYNLKIDLIGCKQYVKLTPTITGTATCAYAVAIGDYANNPPQ